MAKLIGIAFAFASVLMIVLWLIQFKTKNAGIVDVAWSFATALIGIGFALSIESGSFSRNIIVAVMIGLWGARLGLHLLQRVMSESEDGRYHYMRQSLGKYVQPVMFVFFQIQAAWAVLFALPILVAVSNPSSALMWTDYVGVFIWLIAMSGEFIADRQLHHFRNNPDNKGKVCRDGLWHYSRHPNYFFEWLHWWAYIFIAYHSDIWWITWLVMALMLIFLLKITGIPHTEQQALRSRGDAYREYQRTTSIFIPLPPKTT